MYADRTPEQVAWAAGLFEGEGWWGVRGKTSAEASLGTTDRDVAERFASVIGFGTVSTEPRADGHKTLYRWSACSAHRVKVLIELFWPWLGERRRENAQTILAAIKDGPGPNALKTHCPSGHPYDEANTYVYKGDRRCRQCHRDASPRASLRLARPAALTRSCDYCDGPADGWSGGQGSPHRCARGCESYAQDARDAGVARLLLELEANDARNRSEVDAARASLAPDERVRI